MTPAIPATLITLPFAGPLSTPLNARQDLGRKPVRPRVYRDLPDTFGVVDNQDYYTARPNAPEPPPCGYGYLLPSGRPGFLATGYFPRLMVTFELLGDELEPSVRLYGAERHSAAHRQAMARAATGLLRQSQQRLLPFRRAPRGFIHLSHDLSELTLSHGGHTFSVDLLSGGTAARLHVGQAWVAFQMSRTDPQSVTLHLRQPQAAFEVCAAFARSLHAAREEHRGPLKDAWQQVAAFRRQYPLGARSAPSQHAEYPLAQA